MRLDDPPISFGTEEGECADFPNLIDPAGAAP
jgi:hypothetical protein